MEQQKNDLFFILLKLKSYLISLIDDAQNCENEFKYTEEYLERCFPERKSEIINLLEENNIYGDCDIVFDEKIHLKFKEIALKADENLNLKSMLEKFDINSEELIKNEKEKQKYVYERETSLRKVLELLFTLAKEWASHKEIENNVDNYSRLNDEELLRPNEEIKLDNLDVNASISFERIMTFTQKYLDAFADYYFRYGGDISLEKFLKDLEKLKDNVSDKYSKLLKDHGLDSAD